MRATYTSAIDPTNSLTYRASLARGWRVHDLRHWVGAIVAGIADAVALGSYGLANVEAVGVVVVAVVRHIATHIQLRRSEGGKQEKEGSKRIYTRVQLWG